MMDEKIVLELDQKVIDQQSTLEKAGVCGFYITTNPQVGVKAESIRSDSILVLIFFFIYLKKKNLELNEFRITESERIICPLPHQLMGIMPWVGQVCNKSAETRWTGQHPQRSTIFFPVWGEETEQPAVL